MANSDKPIKTGMINNSFANSANGDIRRE